MIELLLDDVRNDYMMCDVYDRFQLANFRTSGECLVQLLLLITRIVQTNRTYYTQGYYCHE